METTFRQNVKVNTGATNVEVGQDKSLRPDTETDGVNGSGAMLATLWQP